MEQQGKKIIIAERDNIAAIMEGKKVQEFFVHRGDVLLGDIYLATVENILPSIEAAFVNVGVDRMGFLHAQDVIGKGALKDKLSPKQKLVVQVTKEPTGHKGPRVTTEISLPGRFLVLIPNETGINVSRKIENIKEKARLKSIVNLLKPVGVGVIVRTEAAGQSESDIQEDLEVLLEKWSNIVSSADSLTPPSLISRDQDLLYRVLREACTDDISEIVVDTAFAMNRVQQLLQNWRMSRNIKVTLYKGNEPLLIATDVHKEIKAALQTKVNMPSGGYLFIQTTEALTVIDVNSGKFTSSATQDETILRTNREAVTEVARQIRLRNIGGMIIVDFIDMTSRVDKLAILEEFELAIEKDKSKPQIGQLSDLGLVELTRHRQGQSLFELFTKKCPHCQGAGYMMEDFKFASATSEGESRAKSSKLKLPISNFKKSSFNNQNANQNVNPDGTANVQNAQPLPSNLVVPQGAEQNEETIEGNAQPQENRNRNKFNRNRNNRFNKNRNNRFASENQDAPANQPVEGQPQGEFKFEQKPEPSNLVKPEQRMEPSNLVKPEQKMEPSNLVRPELNLDAKPEFKQEPKAEFKSEIAPEAKQEAKPVPVKKAKAAPKKESAQVKVATVKADAQEAKTEEEPKKRGRRPNRNTSKTTKTEKVEVKNEETPAPAAIS